MADIVRIIPPNAPRAGQLDSANQALPAVVTPAADRTVTDRLEVDTAGSASPVALLAADDRRRHSTVYNPATDPRSSAAGALLWVGSDPGRPDTFFPLEAGATYDHESHDWLYGWTEPGSPTVVYIITERD